MLHHNLDNVLLFIFSTSILHNDTRIKASKVSKVSNFNEACKWLLIAFVLRNPPLIDYNIWRNYFSKVSLDVATSYTTRIPQICHASYMISFHIHASKSLHLKQLKSQ